MKTTRILKLILIPTLGISAIGTIATVSTSCGSENPDIIHVTAVTLNKISTTLAVGDTETLIATISPQNATDKSVTWSSSDTSVADVDANGKITAVGVGNATITVTTNDGGLTATCEVNVRNPYVVVTANADSTLTLRNNGENNPDLQYSTDGKSWSKYSSELNINQGQTLYLRGNNSTGWSHSISIYSYLSITGDVAVSGNVMALLDNGAAPGEEGDITDIPCDNCFAVLFKDSTGVTSVSEDFLPATRLANSCYCQMFQDCSSLITAPVLPATRLTSYCYQAMFIGCSSLETAPNLPATTLADYCYRAMFEECTSLTTAPELPATTLADGCYQNMFQDCSWLNSIKIRYTDGYSDAYFAYWVKNVSGSGTFYYNGSQTAQDFQLATGWTTKKF